MKPSTETTTAPLAVIGIDIGIALVSAENLHSGYIWDLFLQNREIRKALLRAKIS